MVPAGKEDADALRRSPLEALRRIVSSAAGSAAVNRPFRSDIVSTRNG